MSAQALGEITVADDAISTTESETSGDTHTDEDGSAAHARMMSELRTDGYF